MRTDLSFVTTLMILLSRLGNSTLRKVKTSIISELKNTPHIQQMFGLSKVYHCQKIHLENSMKEKDINSCLYCFECGISESAQQNHQGCHKTQICPHCSKVLLLKPVQSRKVNFLYSTTKTQVGAPFMFPCVMQDGVVKDVFFLS